MAKDTKNKLIETAKDLIGASSYASVGVAEICKQSGVNKGSFYHFFESKEELAIKALEDGFDEFSPILDEIFSKSKPAMQQLDDFVESIFTLSRGKFKESGKVCGCPIINIGTEMSTQNQHFSESVKSIIYKYEEYFISFAQTFIDENLTDNKNAKQLGKQLNAFVIGLKVLSKIENNPDLLKETFKQVILRILGVK